VFYIKATTLHKEDTTPAQVVYKLRAYIDFTHQAEIVGLFFIFASYR